MSEQLSGRLAHLRRFLRSWQAPAAVGLILVIALAVWVMPRKLDRVVSADGRHEWEAGQAAARQFLWEPAQPIEGLLPEGSENASILTPRLTDGGATLYFTHRSPKGNADIYRSRLVDGQWQRGEPLAELNTEADDLGPVLSRDGRHLYLYSNRPGGQGGFDLYVAERTGSGWSKPRNLGPGVNSPAHEYDPALSPDGLNLYFASNRTPGMAAKPPEQADGEWSATLRAHPGLTHFDLYVSRRPTSQDSWAAPEALKELNTDSNEGAPSLSPAGNFLYFASDRPARRGEPPNLDLYRARLIGERFQQVENLGMGINTAAHETEPALSPEGFTLVFSSDRSGDTGIYRSTAQEVYAVTAWDTSNLQAVGAVWWQALTLTLLLALLLAGVLYYRGRLFEKVGPARFVAASLVIHALLLLALWGVPLANTVVQRAEEIRISQQAVPPFDDDPPPPHTDPRPVFEKVAEPKSLEPAPLPEMTRRADPFPAMPERIENLTPTIPLDVARTLPADRLQFVPLKEDPTVRNPLDLPRRNFTKPEMTAARPVVAEPAPAEPTPAEKPIAERSLTPERRASSSPEARELPRHDPTETVGKPGTVEITPATMSREDPAVEAPRRTAERRQPGRTLAPVTTVEKVEVAGLPTVEPRDVNPQAAPVKLDRSVEAGLAPVKGREMPLDRGPPRVEKGTTGVVQPQLIEETPRVSPLTTLPGRATVRARPKPVGEPIEADPTVEVKGTPTTGEKPLTTAAVTLPRSPGTLPEAPRLPSEQMAGPRGTEKQPAIVGNVSGRPLDPSPSVSPLPGSLTRRPGSGMRVARTEDKTGEAPFLLRQDDVRKDVVERFGGSKESEAAVERGLDWLAAHQSRDGNWSLNAFHANCKHPHCTMPANITSDVAGTGLALLPFLAAGNTHKGGKHQPTVARGVLWLVGQQRADGGWMGRGDYRPMYGHGLAAIALCEAYGMTRDPSLKLPAQKAIDFIVKAQHAPSGGWRYTPNSPGDTSVLGWQVMALRSAMLAGLTVPPQTLEGAKRWLKSVEAKTPGGGLYGYLAANPISPAMTAQGLLSLQLMGTRRDDPRMQAGAEYLLKHLPQRNLETSYYWYHATQVMFHMQGKHWKAWNDRMRNLLVETQLTKGPMAGTWDPVDARERAGGRICSTALRLLMLEVYYRHLPLYQQLEK